MYRKLFGEGPSDPFQICSVLHQCTPIGYQTHHLALPCAAFNSFAISSAALSTAPGGPSSRPPSSNPRLISSTRLLPSSEPESNFSASAATRCGVKSYWINSGTTARPAIKFTMLKNLDLTSGLASRAVSGESRQTTFMGLPSQAVSTVAVPLETIAK